METNREKLLRILQHFDITHQYATRNAVNVQCPFCDDGEYHRGVYLDNFKSSCWKCKISVDLLELLNGYVTLSFDEFTRVMEGERMGDEQSPLDQIQSIITRTMVSTTTPPREVEWPPQGTMPLSKLKHDPLVEQFLTKRKFDFDEWVAKDVRIGVVGRYAGRFIFPVLFRKKVVAYQARDMTGRSPAKYLTEGDVSNFLYNFDNIVPSTQLCIAEGIFSGTRIGGNFSCTFSTSLSDTQILLLQELKPDPLVLCWDIGADGSDAFFKARAAMSRLSTHFPNMFWVPLPPGHDPDSLGTNTMRNLIQDSKLPYGNYSTAL